MILPVGDERCYKLLFYHLFCLLLSAYWRFWDSVCTGSDGGIVFLWLGMDSYVHLSKQKSFLFYLCEFCSKTCQEIEFCIWFLLYNFKTSCFRLVQRWWNTQLQSYSWLRLVVWLITDAFWSLSEVICCLRTISRSWWQHFWIDVPLWKRNFPRWR
jgi:hypothetical protein